ncbi:MAG: precorrin-6y C5,15-methyltransferase (decarboxylating) subunit CbiE [Salinarimonas sp.]|nr:precorrin-6y C5,15-methyltransferase (decarboxylating) subunit CbiE [Salinarimonas sp.]
MPDHLPDNHAADQASSSQPRISVVGIGEDGLAGLGAGARAALDIADVVAGGERHLAFLDADPALAGKERLPWGAPFAESLKALVARREAEPALRIAILASGDPFWHGAGGSLMQHLPIDALTIHPAPSTFALACARLGWRLEESVTLGLHARPIRLMRPHLHHGARLIVLVRDAAAIAEAAALLRETGCGASRLTLLERLGGPHERIRSLRADAALPDDIAAPVALAIHVEAAPDAALIPRAPGLPDDCFANDGQLTKREIRAMTLAALAPCPGELLWDIGAGAGSIAIEWCLAHPQNRAIGIEARPDRLERAAQNALALGVPHIDFRAGRAPDALTGLEPPDAIFIGGGASREGVVDAALAALKPGGRLVINAVTLETEALLIALHARLGGDLIRIALSRATSVGEMRGWRAAMPVTQWCYRS